MTTQKRWDPARMQNLVRVMNPGAGNVFYVNGLTGNNAYDGTTPETARLTITSALSLCTNDEAAQDYVIVLRYPSADPGEAAWPIAVAYAGVHIIGAGLFGAGPNCYINPPDDTAAFSLAANGIEIAGFDLAGGATHGCIENNGAIWRAWIHHNDINLQRTSQDGIRIGVGPADCPEWLIENNKFGNIADAFPTRDCIRIEQNMTRGTIRNNQFWVGVGVVGVHFQGLCTGYIWCVDNKFYVTDSAAGEAITSLDANCNAFICNNFAGQGKVAMANNPYLDTGGAANWVLNYSTAAILNAA